MGKEIESSELQNQPKQLHKDDDIMQKNTVKEEEKNHVGDHDDEQVLKFMDSLDSYLTLMHSLSSTLRQGWFDFASARYSMGASRVNGALLDLKEHPAATHLEVRKDEESNFTLCKWAPVSDGDSRQTKDDGSGLKHQSHSMHQRDRDTSESTEAEEDNSPIDGPSVTLDDQVQKERRKSLAVFGTLVSPKLRSSQLSFETALETLVEIANVRASMLSAFDQVRGEIDGVKN